MSKRKPRVHQSSNQAQHTTRDGFANFTASLGIGANNTFSDGMYIANNTTKNRINLENMYRGSWIAGKVVDDFADDMTRAGIDIVCKDDPEQVAELQAELVRLKTWQTVGDLIKWARLYGGAIGVLQIDGQDSTQLLDANRVAKGAYKGLAIFDRWSVEPDLTRVIQSGPDMGLPEFYRIITGINQGKASEWTAWIHHTRIIRMVGIKLPYWQALTESMWGESVIERLYDRLMAYDTASLGAANLINRAHLRQVGVKGLRDILSAGGKAEENLVTMFRYVRELQTSEGLTLLDADDEMTYNSYTFAGLPDMLLQFGQQVSGASGIPLVRLFGQSPAGLNSSGESDIRQYYDTIKCRQEADLRDGINVVLSCVYASKLGKPRPESMVFDFRSLWQMSETEKATLAETSAKAIDIALASGVIDDATAAKEYAQLAAKTGIFSNITDEYIAELEAEPPAPSESEVLSDEIMP